MRIHATSCVLSTQPQATPAQLPAPLPPPRASKPTPAPFCLAVGLQAPNTERTASPRVLADRLVNMDGLLRGQIFAGSIKSALALAHGETDVYVHPGDAGITQSYLVGHQYFEHLIDVLVRIVTPETMQRLTEVDPAITAALNRMYLLNTVSTVRLALGLRLHYPETEAASLPFSQETHAMAAEAIDTLAPSMQSNGYTSAAATDVAQRMSAEEVQLLRDFSRTELGHKIAAIVVNPEMQYFEHHEFNDNDVLKHQLIQALS